VSLQVLCDGTWLASVAGVGDLTFSTVADGGSESASWRMDLRRSFTHPALRNGALVQIRAGAVNVWRGVLSEPDRSDDDGWTFNAAGLATEGAGYICFDASLNTSSKPDESIDQAIARGLRWQRPNSLSNVDFAASGQTDALNKVTDLLNAWSTSVSKRWGVDPDGNVYAAADPTEPSWHLRMGGGKVGLAEDEYASDLYLRYQPTSTTYATAHVADSIASSGRRWEEGVDATTLGVITGAKAAGVGDGMIARGKARYAWTQAAEPSRLQITTPGGTPAYLPFVKAGQMVRLHDVLNEQGLPVSYVDFIIGRTEYAAGSDTIKIAPAQLAARTLGDVLQVAVNN